MSYRSTAIKTTFDRRPRRVVLLISAIALVCSFSSVSLAKTYSTLNIATFGAKIENTAPRDSDDYLAYNSPTPAKIYYRVHPVSTKVDFRPRSVKLYIKHGSSTVRIVSLPAKAGDGLTTWNGKNSAGSPVNPGVYTATIEVTASNKKVTSDPHNITVVKVESITGLQTLYCTHQACSQVVTANLTGGIELPAGYTIVWGGDATFENISGRTATAKFAGHAGKNLKITAKFDTQTPPTESLPYTVVDHTLVTGVTVVTYNYVWKDPGSNYGVTARGPIVTDITAYFDHPSHTWKCKVTTSTSEIQTGSHLVAGVAEANVAACTSEAIYRKMVADLQAYGEGSGVQWYMVAAVEAHEQVHADDWIAGNNPCFTTFQTTVEALSVAYTDPACDTPGEAKTAIKALPAYTTAYSTYITDGNAVWSSIGHPGCNARTYAAEAGVTTPMINALDAHAAAQTPPWIR